MSSPDQRRLSLSYEDFDSAEEATSLVEKARETSVSDNEDCFKVPAKRQRGRGKQLRGTARRLRSSSRTRSASYAKYSDDEPEHHAIYTD